MRTNEDSEFIRIKRLIEKRDLIPSPMSPDINQESLLSQNLPQVKKECLSPMKSPMKSPIREIRKECITPPMTPIRNIEELILEKENLRKELEREKLMREHNYFLFKEASEGRSYYYKKYKHANAWAIFYNRELLKK